MAYVGNNLTVQQYAPQIAYFSGNGSTMAFTLPVAVVSAAQIIVAIDNVIQNPSSAFSVSGTTITFTSAPLTGTNNIWVEYTSLQTNTIAPSAGTVQNSSFAAGASEFAAGTALLFNQTAAPTGWTKVTTNDNAALRIVSGSVGSGGSVNFTTAFASQAVAGSVSTSVTGVSGSVSVGSTTLSTSQIPDHLHYRNTSYLDEYIILTAAGSYQLVPGAAGLTAAGITGYMYNSSGGSHNHSGSFSFSSGTASSSFSGTAINLAVKYVDAIVATKN
jgi:hypothetical protein